MMRLPSFCLPAGSCVTSRLVSFTVYSASARIEILGNVSKIVRSLISLFPVFCFALRAIGIPFVSSSFALSEVLRYSYSWSSCSIYFHVKC
ncbi:hypothetical protein RIF29_46994 [Crotalaria pallida]|uniref:Uncharacterized protein n=1 Tax=Crotalaria pallida TaxID=3830 RepID=A0AAN9DTJ8_CROPI